LKSGPAVSIIPGSGPTDRDGNNPAGVKASTTYRLLAEGPASRGVATLRIDKRGMYQHDLDAMSLELMAVAQKR
jgi:hypothetical protein